MQINKDFRSFDLEITLSQSDITGFGIIQALQFCNELLFRVSDIRIKYEAIRIYPGRKVPLFAVEAIGNFSGKIKSVDRQRNKNDEETPEKYKKSTP